MRSNEISLFKSNEFIDKLIVYWSVCDNELYDIGLCAKNYSFVVVTQTFSERLNAATWL